MSEFEEPYLVRLPDGEGQYEFNLKAGSESCPHCDAPLVWYRAWYPKKTLKYRCSRKGCDFKLKEEE